MYTVEHFFAVLATPHFKRSYRIHVKTPLSLTNCKTGKRFEFACEYGCHFSLKNRENRQLEFSWRESPSRPSVIPKLSTKYCTIMFVLFACSTSILMYMCVFVRGCCLSVIIYFTYLDPNAPDEDYTCRRKTSAAGTLNSGTLVHLY